MSFLWGLTLFSCSKPGCYVNFLVLTPQISYTAGKWNLPICDPRGSSQRQSKSLNVAIYCFPKKLLLDSFSLNILFLIDSLYPSLLLMNKFSPLHCFQMTVFLLASIHAVKSTLSAFSSFSPFLPLLTQAKCRGGKSLTNITILSLALHSSFCLGQCLELLAHTAQQSMHEQPGQFPLML